MLKKIIINSSLSFTAVLLVLILLEGSARIFHLSPLWEGVKRGYFQDNMARFFIQDKTLGWRGKPNLDLIFQKWQGEFRSHIITNSKGFRCHDIPYHKTDKKKRILFLGDSFGWGFGVSNSEMFSYILQSNCNEDMEVINLSVSGYGLVQYYLMYKTEGIKYNPDIVVLLFYIGNDLYIRHAGADIGGINGPYFILNNDKLTFHPNEYTLRSKKEFEQWGERKGLLNQIKYFIQTHSALSNFLFERLSNFPKLIPFLRVGSGIPIGELFILRKITPDDIYMTTKILKYFEAEAKGNSADFIIAIIPDIYHVETAVRSSNINYEDQIFKPIFWLTKSLESANILHINLLEEFTSPQWRDKKLYYTIDRHLNQEGHRALEQILEEKLSKQQYKDN